jgi:predicted ATP-binding protein involved in virulence
MQIDRLTLDNFNGFEHREFTFNPRFNLLVGDNASGKTSVLDALAISAGSWFLGLRGVERSPGIEAEQVRVVAHQHLDSFTFEKQFPVRIESDGSVLGARVKWARELLLEGGRTTSGDTKAVRDAANVAEQRVRAGEDIVLPLICAYGTERLWFERSHRAKKQADNGTRKQPSRFDGYRDCFNFTIQETDLINWFRDQATAYPYLKADPIAVQIVKDAIRSCVEEAETVYYDGRYKDLVVVMDRSGPQLFRNLSDGQRIMLTMVGDLAKRAVTLNPDLENRALRDTPGIVMIDELDLHLHPKWQRRVVHDLKNTFTSLQFIATTHSPQLIGEAFPEEIRLLDDESVTTPARSFGIDSSRILEEVMGAMPRTPSVETLLSKLSKSIDREDFDTASSLLTEVEAKLGPDDPEVTRARALMTFLKTSE